MDSGKGVHQRLGTLDGGLLRNRGGSSTKE